VKNSLGSNWPQRTPTLNIEWGQIDPKGNRRVKWWKSQLEQEFPLRYLLLLEDVRVLPQAQRAEQLGQVRAFQRRVQAAAVAAGYRGDAVHVVAAAEVMLCSCSSERQKPRKNTMIISKERKKAATMNSGYSYHSR